MRTRPFSLAVLSGCLVASCAPKTEERTVWMPVDAATGDVPAFVLWGKAGNVWRVDGEMPSDVPGVIVAAWEDGRVVFSHDSSDGGPPYSRRRVDPAKVDSVRQRAWDSMDALELRGWAFLCGSATEMFVAGPNRSQVVTSAFDMTPYNERVIYTDRGLESLDGRDPKQVIAAQSASFRAFVQGWAEAAGSMRGLIDTTLATTTDDPTRFERVTVLASR